MLTYPFIVRLVVVDRSGEGGHNERPGLRGWRRLGVRSKRMRSGNRRSYEGQGSDWCMWPSDGLLRSNGRRYDGSSGGDIYGGSEWGCRGMRGDWSPYLKSTRS